jgi:hypothetical protein
MPPDLSKCKIAALFAMITQLVKKAQGIAVAAETCAAGGNHNNAFRILLNIEELTHDVTVC